ncbi:OmpA family protein [Sphingomonas hengshuiensis]|nr:OmpA family protein [Sphingomonas hengshuiensis]
MNDPQLDLRQDKSYRRGLVLGLTMAEVMILLLFVLLMALAAALQNRDDRIRVLDGGGASRMVEELQRAYPQAKSSDDYFKELTRAIEARRQVEEAGAKDGTKNLLADAEVGRQVREAAASSGVKDPEKFVKEVVAASTKGRKGQWPPFFSLSEAGGYFFDSGKATLRPEFERSLRSEVIPMLAKSVADYDVDVIEVIGHTDEVPMSGISNLDAALIQASVGRVPIGALRSNDNAGLAMARAVAVVQQLRADPRLRGAVILPLSGAQMIVPVDGVANGSARGSDQRRRRIEIRLRKSTQQASPVVRR